MGHISEMGRTLQGQISCYMPVLSHEGAPLRGSDSNESTCNAGGPNSNPGLVRFPGAGHGDPLHLPTWRIPWTEEPRGIQSMRSQRVGHG